ncbi:hypothetical protein C7B62_22810 [Pleurocapsa sp. CCALA 161]|uniref:DUF3611 family protein n=1 Tax=Pleurocapsa sp. CCALA 161 TaxID=2107688 RepID=UPI000D07F493|nr:DUF3611 family protein [Pleurocapsa sp. CCALA 161]PSB06453.1 hypothetical protein C7B62_22810 [Pleurocapsa sp. CCALA 161]
MDELVESTNNNQLPNKQKFARTLYTLGRISYWIHLVLGVISGLTLLLVVFSRNATNSGTGIGIFIAMFSFLALCFGVYWAWRYSRLAKKLQRVDPETQPSRIEIIQVLRIGLLASFGGLMLALIATEISLVSLVANAIARPQGLAVFEREHIITVADLLLVLAQVNILGAHFFGSANCLGLLSWILRAEI